MRKSSTYSKRFADRLRELRNQTGLSVEDAAKAIQAASVPPTTVNKFRVYKWETGASRPPCDLYPAIASALEVKVRTIFPVE